MAKVTFYVLPSPGEAALAKAVATIVGQLAKQRRRVVVIASNQAQAELIDEALWQIPAAQFIPHNLVGEGPIAGTPVLIGWDQSAAELCKQRNVVLNLQPVVPELTRQIQVIIDFVPADDAGKEQARERYRHYRSLGMQLDTQPAPEENEGHHG